VGRVRKQGHKVAAVHLRHLNPFPEDLGAILSRYQRVVVPEINSGQLAHLLRAKYLVDAVSIAKVRGKPLRVDDLTDELLHAVKGVAS
jgi:2-oxoglutarate ferredoxin oxidoreductase subunit alpha